MLKPWYIYIIQAKNGNLYTGITVDIKRRWQEHTCDNKVTSKGAKFFRTSQPESIVYIQQVEGRSNASRREAEIKKLSRIKKLALLDSDINRLEILT